MKMLLGFFIAIALGTVTAVTAQSYQEAPALAQRVASGELPPVSERLPIASDIMVVEPVEQVGQYGGTWRTSTFSAEASDFRMTLYDPPVRWAPDYSEYIPGLAKSWAYNEDGTQLTFSFREGVKWSDGTPFTTEDLQFWWVDLANNQEFLSVSVPFWARRLDGEPIDITFPDAYTMVLTWDRPYWIAHTVIAQGYWEWDALMRPKHFLSQFHPDYNDAATYDQLEANINWYQTPDYPTLYAWQLVSYVPGERWVLERNPYYWKTDTSGNQLPYIDNIEVELVADQEVRLLNTTQGRYDAVFRGLDDPNLLPLLLETAEAGGYRVANYMKGMGGQPNWMVNQDYTGPGADAELDSEMRALLRSKVFRQAISHALDREQVVEVLYAGFGIPQQMTISPQSIHFASPEGQEVFNEMATAYSEYDPELANQLLDSAGLTERDAEGFRTLPSGKRLEIVIDVWDYGSIDQSTLGSELLKNDLAAVGIRSRINVLADANAWDLTLQNASYMLSEVAAAEMDLWTYPDWIFPVRGNRAWPLQGKWHATGGEEGEQPEASSPAARLYALYTQGLSEPDFESRQQLVWEALRIHIEEGPFNIGAAGDQPQPVVVKTNFRNVPDTGVLGPWAPGSPGNQFPEQFFIQSE